jgi:hypothetical protein
LVPSAFSLLPSAFFTFGVPPSSGKHFRIQPSSFCLGSSAGQVLEIDQATVLDLQIVQKHGRTPLTAFRAGSASTPCKILSIVGTDPLTVWRKASSSMDVRILAIYFRKMALMGLN